MSWRSEYRILYDKMLFSGIVIKVRTFNVVFPFDQNHIRFYNLIGLSTPGQSLIPIDYRWTYN